MSERWSREEPQFFDVDELPWERGGGPRALHEVDTRLLSRDPRTGAATYMARLPPGFRAVEEADEAALELFLLEGDLSADGRRVGAGGFIAIPRGCGPCELSSEGGAQVYLFCNPGVLGTDSYGGRLHVAKVWQEQWVLGDVPGIRHGRLYKPLRVPDPVSDGLHGGSGGLLHLVCQLPGFRLRELEVHDCWEEAIFLGGDNLMLGRGSFAAGTYIANPAGHVHGVMMTQRGSLLLRHTNEPLSVEYLPCPGEAELIERYLGTTSFLAEPRTELWRDRPESREFAALDQRIV